MSFWSKTTAAPSFWNKLQFQTTPKFIRTEAIPYPPIPNGITKPMQFFRADAAHIATFWKHNYGGDDWYLDCDEEFVLRYFNQLHVYIFGIYTIDTIELIGTIVSCPITLGKTKMSHGAELSNVRAIEGLCLDKRFRGQGLAGFLIGYMDAFTSQMNPTVHVWSRETNESSFFSAALRTDVYAYKKCLNELLKTDLLKMNWDSFCELWTQSISHWQTDKKPRIITSMPLNIHGDTDVWSEPADSLSQIRRVTVITNTYRKTMDGKNPIFEVVWCGYVQNNILYPAESTIQYKRFIEKITTKYDGLLFVTSALYNGQASLAWGEPWKYGTSGKHSWHIYNFIPPAFGTCELHVIRNEL